MKNRFLHTRFPDIPTVGTAFGAFALLILIALIDYYTGTVYDLSVFYVFPIFIAAWFVGFPLGIGFAVLSAVLWILNDVVAYNDAFWSFSLVWNIGVHAATYLIIVFLLNRLRTQQYQLIKLVGQDPLTGLSNRRTFYDAANKEIHKARRYSSAFTVAYIDVDDFKKINDVYGHNRGDAVLRRIAATMRQNTRIVDTVARIGGDEFVILFPETDADDARTAVQKIRSLLNEAMRVEGYPVTFSIGVVTFLEAPISLDVMIEMVDRAMYTVKQTAKNNVLFQTNQNAHP